MAHNCKWWWDVTFPFRVAIAMFLAIATPAWATVEFGLLVPIGLLGVGIIIVLVIFGIVHANEEAKGE